jgi:predicted nucleotidyltransferase
MVKIPDKIRAIAERYILLLKENNISVENAYLFGSYAKGNNNEWSDIDIAIVSGAFEGIRIKDRDKIRKLTLSVSSSLEILPFSPRDFSFENPLAKEIIETGIRLV